MFLSGEKETRILTGTEQNLTMELVQERTKKTDEYIQSILVDGCIPRIYYKKDFRRTGNCAYLHVDNPEATKIEMVESKLLTEKLLSAHGKVKPFMHSYGSNNPLAWIFYVKRGNRIKFMDHIVKFQDAFVTCPYALSSAYFGEGGHLREASEIIEMLPKSKHFTLKATRLDTPLYHSWTEPLLITCEWTNGVKNLCWRRDLTKEEKKYITEIRWARSVRALK